MAAEQANGSGARGGTKWGNQGRRGKQRGEQRGKERKKQRAAKQADAFGHTGRAGAPTPGGQPAGYFFANWICGLPCPTVPGLFLLASCCASCDGTAALLSSKNFLRS